MSCRIVLIFVGLSWAVGMVLLVLLLEGVGVGVVEALEVSFFMLRFVGFVERDSEGEERSGYFGGYSGVVVIFYFV